MAVCATPPTTMPASAATPPFSPSTRVLPSTKAMSMPGSTMMPNTRMKKSQSCESCGVWARENHSMVNDLRVEESACCAAYHVT